MLYKNTKAMFRFPDGDIDYFDIIARLKHWDSFAPYLFVIYLYYVLRTLTEELNNFPKKLWQTLT